MLKSITPILFFIFLTGCSSKNEFDIPGYIKSLDNLTVFSADEEPIYSIKLERELSFGNAENVLIGRLGGMAVDGTDRVFIVDGDQYTVHVFHSDGSYLTSLGRRGHGPGEFVSIPSPIIISDQLYLYDLMHLRINAYSLTSLDFSHTQNLNPRNISSIEELDGFRPAQFFFINDGTYLVLFLQSIRADPESPWYNADSLYRLYYLMDNEGRIISDKILKQRTLVHLSATVGGEYRSATGFPFVGESLIKLSEDAQIYSAWSEDFLIEVRNSKGEYLYAFYYPYDNVKLTRQDALNTTNLEYRQSIIQRAELPETWPALNNLLVDDENRLWISTIVDDFDIYEWWVLKDTGELITTFEWPRNEPIEVVKNGYMYTRETDEDTGLQQIVRYRIEMEEV